MAMSKLVVVGGNGFLGSRVCQVAVQKGLEVVSISRSGVPPHRQPWTKSVQWAKGDVLGPDMNSIGTLLSGAGGIVHTVGILLEDSKLPGVLKGNTTPQASKESTTYEKANRDAAIAVAHAAVAAGVKRFLYISAASAPPLVDERYITTKREAEAALLKMEAMDTVILRPGLMYDEDEIVSRALGLAIGSFNSACNSGWLGNLPKLIGRDKIVRPLNVMTVAEAVIHAIADAQCKGVYDIDAIDRLSADLRQSL